MSIPWRPRRSYQIIVDLAAVCIVVTFAINGVIALRSIIVGHSWTETLAIAMPQMHRTFLLGLLCFVAVAVWRSISIRRFALLAIAAALLIEIDAFEYGLHPWALESGLHPLLFIGYETRDINPQWSKLLAASPFAAYSAVRLLDRSWRTMDRMFLFIIGTSVVATTALFHPVIDKGITRASLYELKLRIEDGLTGAPEDFQRLCDRWEADCARVERGKFGTIVLAAPSGIRRVASTSEVQWFSSINDAIGQGEDGHHVGLTGDIDGSISPAKLMLAIRYLGTETFTVSLKSLPGSIVQRSQAWFCFLTICAHSTWIFGGLIVLLLHKRNRSKQSNYRT